MYIHIYYHSLSCAVPRGMFPWRTRYPLSYIPTKPVPTCPEPKPKGAPKRGLQPEVGAP